MIPLRPLLPTRNSRLRMLAHTRHIIMVTLPLGAGTGFLVALALRGLGSFEPMVWRIGGETRMTILLPAIGLFLTTAWLSVTGIGESSLFKDLDLAKQKPYQVFPFRASLGKVLACALTIGLGGLWLPSLAMGAAAGAAVDGVLGLGQTGYLVLVGAAAMAGATHETLLVPVVFLAETTAQAALVVPALIATTVSYLIVREAS